jgi:hypothetical protein
VTVAYVDLEDGKRVSQTKINRFPLILLESIHNTTSLSPNTLKDLPRDFNPALIFVCQEPSTYQEGLGLLCPLLSCLSAVEREGHSDPGKIGDA